MVVKVLKEDKKGDGGDFWFGRLGWGIAMVGNKHEGALTQLILCSLSLLKWDAMSNFFIFGGGGLFVHGKKDWRFVLDG